MDDNIPDEYVDLSFGTYLLSTRGQASSILRVHHVTTPK